MRTTHDRSIIAARAALRSTDRPVLAPSTDLRARTLTVVKPSGAGIRRRKCKMTGAQRNSEGRRSEWSLPMNLRDAVATDPKWSQTVRSQNV